MSRYIVEKELNEQTNKELIQQGINIEQLRLTFEKSVKEKFKLDPDEIFWHAKEMRYTQLSSMQIHWMFFKLGYLARKP